MCHITVENIQVRSTDMRLIALNDEAKLNSRKCSNLGSKKGKRFGQNSSLVSDRKCSDFGSQKGKKIGKIRM